MTTVMTTVANPSPHRLHGPPSPGMDRPHRSVGDAADDDGDGPVVSGLPVVRSRAGTWSAEGETSDSESATAMAAFAAAAASSLGRPNRVRAETWGAGGGASDKKIPRDGRERGGGLSGRIHPRMDRSNSLVDVHGSGSVVANNNGQNIDRRGGPQPLLVQQSASSGSLIANPSRGDEKKEEEESGDADANADADAASISSEPLTPLASAHSRKTMPQQPRSAPSSRRPRLSEDGAVRMAGTTVDARLSPLREHRQQRDTPGSAPPSAQIHWDDDDGWSGGQHASGGARGENEVSRARTSSWASAGAVTVGPMATQRSNSMGVNDLPSPNSLSVIASTSPDPSPDTDTVAESDVSARGRNDSSEDMSSVVSDDWGGSTGGTASSEGPELQPPKCLQSPSPEARPRQGQQYPGAALPVVAVPPPLLEPTKPRDDTPQPGNYPLPLWMTTRDDAGVEKKDHEDDEAFSVGAVGDQSRRSRSITFAAASAAPIMRMAARARRTQSAEDLDQTTLLLNEADDDDGSDADTSDADIFKQRGPLTTVPGSPESDAHSKHGDYAGDDSYQSDQSASSESSDIFLPEGGFEKPHDLLFDDEGNSVLADDSSSPTSCSSDRAVLDSSSSSGGGDKNGLASRWRMARKKRRQQQQKSCDQLYDDEGHVVASATPRAALPPVRRTAPVSDGWRILATSSPSSEPPAPTLGAPPESAPPALAASSVRAAGATSRRLGPAFDGVSSSAAASVSSQQSSVSTVPTSNAAAAALSSAQRFAGGHLSTIADEADSDNLADVAATAAMARAAGGSSRRPDAGGEDVDTRPMWKQLIDYFRYRPLKKKILTITVILSVILVIIDFATLELIRGWMVGFLTWMQHHPWPGFFVFIGLFIVTTLVFIPPSILTFGAGFVFAKAFGLGPGVFAATFSCFLGASSGAVLAFFRARYMMRDLVKLFSNRYPIVKAADAALKHKGFRIMFLLRLCPLIPFNALNYIGGITGVDWKDYTFALFGLLPFMITTIFLGATAGTVSNKKAGEDKIANIVSIVVGCSVSVVAVVLIWYFARKELHREIAAHQGMERREQESVRSESGSELEFESVDDLEASRHSRAMTESDMSLEASLGDSSAAFGQQREEDLYHEEWYWIWT